MEPTWEEAKALLPIGMQVTGRVTDCHHFGAFVDQGIGFRGLLEIVNFTDARTNSRNLRYPDVGSTITAWVYYYSDHNQQIMLTQLPKTDEEWERIRRL